MLTCHSAGWRNRFPESRICRSGESIDRTEICAKNSVQNFPEHSYPSIVGRPILRSEERAGDIVVKDIMCGDEAAAARSALQITYPVYDNPESGKR